MQSKEDVLKALDAGKKLVSNVTGYHYILIDGKLHSRHGERRDWQPSELYFDNPPSWLNLLD
jgi:hypothetical protein